MIKYTNAIENDGKIKIRNKTRMIMTNMLKALTGRFTPRCFWQDFNSLQHQEDAYGFAARQKANLTV